MDDRQTQSLTGQAGLRLQTAWQSGALSMTPRLGIYWLQELLDDAPQLEAHFQDYGDSSFRLTGRELDQKRARLEAGLELMLNGCVSASVAYSLEWGDSYHSQSISAGINISY